MSEGPKVIIKESLKVKSVGDIISSRNQMKVVRYYHNHLRMNLDRLETVVFPFKAGKRLVLSTGH